MINRAVNDLDNRLVNEVAALRRELIQMKTNQSIGGDVLAVDAFPAFSSAPASVGPITVPSKDQTIINLTVSPAQDYLTLVNAMFTVYIDFYDAAHRWPNGASITPNLYQVSVFEDLYSFNTTTNAHTFVVVVDNYDPVSAHDIYVTARMLLPKLTGTA